MLNLSDVLDVVASLEPSRLSFPKLTLSAYNFAPRPISPCHVGFSTPAGRSSLLRLFDIRLFSALPTKARGMACDERSESQKEGIFMTLERC